jgi:hypothetical protein
MNVVNARGLTSWLNFVVHFASHWMTSDLQCCDMRCVGSYLLRGVDRKNVTNESIAIVSRGGGADEVLNNQYACR